MNKWNNYVDLLKELSRYPSVVGSEHAFFLSLKRVLEERGAAVTWYEGVLVAKGRAPYSCMMSAHIDRHGLLCTGPNEFQYAAFVVGGRSDLLNNSVSEELMSKIANRFESMPVYAYEPWSGSYLGAGLIKDTYICPTRHNLIFEIDGLSHLAAETPVAFQNRLIVDKKKNTFQGQLDNVLTAAFLVHLFDLGYEGTAFFTAQEESGSSWRYLLEWFRRFGNETNNLIVLDTSPFPNEEEAFKQSVVLRYKDANATFNADASDMLANICRQKEVNYLFKDLYIEEVNSTVKDSQSKRSLGSTELGRITNASQGLVQGTTLQIPTLGYHTLDETVSIDACKDFLSVLKAVAIKS